MSRQRITSTSFCDDENCPGHVLVSYGPEGMVMTIGNDPSRPMVWAAE